VPSQLGVDYSTALLEMIAREIGPTRGWSSKNPASPADSRHVPPIFQVGDRHAIRVELDSTPPARDRRHVSSKNVSLST
jgi:hypothetical protein